MSRGTENDGYFTPPPGPGPLVFDSTPPSSPPRKPVVSRSSSPGRVNTTSTIRAESGSVAEVLDSDEELDEEVVSWGSGLQGGSRVAEVMASPAESGYASSSHGTPIPGTPIPSSSDAVKLSAIIKSRNAKDIALFFRNYDSDFTGLVADTEYGDPCSIVDFLFLEYRAGFVEEEFVRDVYKRLADNILANLDKYAKEKVYEDLVFWACDSSLADVAIEAFENALPKIDDDERLSVVVDGFLTREGFEAVPQEFFDIFSADDNFIALLLEGDVEGVLPLIYGSNNRNKLIFEVADNRPDLMDGMMEEIGKDELLGLKLDENDLMIFSVLRGNYHLMELLCDSGWDVAKRYQDLEGRNILHIVVDAQNHSMAKILCKTNCDIVLQKNEKGVDSCRALACEGGLGSYYDLLVRMHGDVDGEHDYSGDFYTLFNLAFKRTLGAGGRLADWEGDIEFYDKRGSGFVDRGTSIISFMRYFVNRDQDISNDDLKILMRCLNVDFDFNEEIDGEGRCLLELVAQDAKFDNGSAFKDPNFVKFFSMLIFKSDNGVKAWVAEDLSEVFEFSDLVGIIDKGLHLLVGNRDYKLDEGQFCDLFDFVKDLCLQEKGKDVYREDTEGLTAGFVRVNEVENGVSSQLIDGRLFDQFDKVGGCKNLMADILIHSGLLCDDCGHAFSLLNTVEDAGIRVGLQQEIIACVSQDDINKHLGRLFYDYLDDATESLAFSAEVVHKLVKGDIFVYQHDDLGFEKAIVILSGVYDKATESHFSAVRKSEIWQDAVKLAENFPRASKVLCDVESRIEVAGRKVPSLLTNILDRVVGRQDGAAAGTSPAIPVSPYVAQCLNNMARGSDSSLPPPPR